MLLRYPHLWEVCIASPFGRRGRSLAREGDVKEPAGPTHSYPVDRPAHITRITGATGRWQ